MTLNNLTVSFSHLNRESILEDWEWLLKGKYLPILLSASGDAFVQHLQTNDVWWLDTGSAELNRVAESYEEFSQLLSDKEFVVECFAVQMIGDLIQAGKLLKSGQIYSLSIPFLLGGKYELSNIEPMDISVHFSVLGQVSRQVGAGES